MVHWAGGKGEIRPIRFVMCAFQTWLCLHFTSVCLKMILVPRALNYLAKHSWDLFQFSQNDAIMFLRFLSSCQMKADCLLLYCWVLPNPFSFSEPSDIYYLRCMTPYDFFFLSPFIRCISSLCFLLTSSFTLRRFLAFIFLHSQPLLGCSWFPLFFFFLKSTFCRYYFILSHNNTVMPLVFFTPV